MRRFTASWESRVWASRSLVSILMDSSSIQWIAQAFHQRSYADRIDDQRRARRIITILYQHSSEIPGRDDTLRDSAVVNHSSLNPQKLVKRALRGVRDVATTTTTALGNVASEIAGRQVCFYLKNSYIMPSRFTSSVLQPNSPPAIVRQTLLSANKSRLVCRLHWQSDTWKCWQPSYLKLARRLFYSFRSSGASVVVPNDIAKYFASVEEAAVAFNLFDKDGNGDCTRDEFEAACLFVFT